MGWQCSAGSLQKDFQKRRVMAYFTCDQTIVLILTVLDWIIQCSTHCKSLFAGVKQGFPKNKSCLSHLTVLMGLPV